MHEKSIIWNAEKNASLKRQRGIGFEDIVSAIKEGKLLATISNPNSIYPNQQMFIVEIDQYAIVVPHVTEGSTIFLKTLFASRKATAQFLKPRK